MMDFKHKVLCIGFGSVGKCALPILLEHIHIPYKNITVLDFADKRKELAPWIKKGIRYSQGKADPRQRGENTFQIRLSRRHDHRPFLEYRLPRHALLVP